MGLRKENRVFVVLLLSILVISALTPFYIRVSWASTLVVPDDYLTIQGAVDASDSGATVFVRSGIYREHVSVNKSLSLVGEARETTTIDGNGVGTVVHVTANNVSVSGFRIQNGETGLDFKGNGNMVTTNIFLRTGTKVTESRTNLEVLSEPPVSPVWRYLYDLIGARFTEVFQLTTKASAVKVKVLGRDGVAQLTLGLFYDANNDGVPQFQEFTGYASRDKETDVSLADPPLGQYIIKVQGWDVTGNPGHFDREITTYRGYGLAVHSSSNCTITGNLFKDNYAGLSIQSSSHVQVHDNDVIRNLEGVNAGDLADSTFFNNTVSETVAGEVYGAGFSLRSSSRVNLTGNSVSLKAFGINLWNSSDNSVSENELSSNAGWGIDLHSSWENSLSDNRISYSAGLDGIRLMFSSANFLSKNRISYSEHSGILLWYDCYNNTIVDNSIQRGGYQGWGHGHGVEVLFSYGNLFADNSIFNNNNGIIVIEASDNTFTENLIYSNPLGMQIKYATGNHVYHNSFVDNWQWQALDETGGNFWDDAYPSGGNYWSEYAWTDQSSGPYQNVTGSDGIADSPYPIEASEEDAYPLTKPYSAVPRLGDLNGDRRVNILDLTMVAVAFNSVPGNPNWNQTADINGDGNVNIIDIVVVALHFGESS
jgi:parallel beta-helix repeat protein